MPTLTPAARRALRANAHSLHPVVAVGQHGLTAAVLQEVDVALKAHELIKVRVFDDDRAAREAMLERICAELDCAAVQHIGKLLVVWRPHPDKAAPKAKPAATPRKRSPEPKRPPHGPAPREAAARRRRALAPAPAAAEPAGRRQRSHNRTEAAAGPATRGAPSRRRRRTVKT
jgi:RNA-binding protein